MLVVKAISLANTLCLQAFHGNLRMEKETEYTKTQEFLLEHWQTVNDYKVSGGAQKDCCYLSKHARKENCNMLT